jgi:hypothetical protein
MFTYIQQLLSSGIVTIFLWILLILQNLSGLYMSTFMPLYLSEDLVWERGEAYTGFWWGNLREKDHW